MFTFNLEDLSQGIRNGPEDDIVEVLLFAIVERLQANSLLSKEWVCICDEFGRNLLHYVAGLGYINLLEPLLTNEILINSVDNEGRTALHYCAKGGYTEMACALLSYGVYLCVILISIFYRLTKQLTINMV